MYGSLTVLNGISFYFHILVLIVYTVIALSKRLLPYEKIQQTVASITVLYHPAAIVSAFFWLVLFV